ncbi:uncharacterized protein KY384_006413 [Bacidia gigantensis]|uniref:uncharacterized protein n=1 Tax=Bacidia gigantensis TaxID=2732470 RepID=UPI001D04DF33|nr:uncharacterized protein KY384_006413 [Bacidia gigantensis]KAG8528726.1 hypothetical protein KY384_006413 [Bacidia gigantensis]
MFFQGYRMTVIRCDQISEYEEWSKDLETQPHSLAISRQGHRIAVGFARATNIFDGAKGSSEILPAAMPHDQAAFQVDSQCMSFSTCGNHLVVATREPREGYVYVGVHDLSPLRRYSQQMQDFRIPKGHTFLIDRASTRPSQMTHRDFNPFPGDQIQCATALPGQIPRICLVNDGNKVFVLRYQDKNWKSEPTKVKLDRARKDVGKYEDKMSIGATETGIIRTFWMQGDEGRMLSVHQNEAGRFEVEKISMAGRLC